ncbi:3837_t:CDS:2, partial [Funneliformis mosseae]
MSCIWLAIAEGQGMPPNDKAQRLLIENEYRSIVSLKAIKALNTLQEVSLDYTQEEIDQNIRVLKSKLSSLLTKPDASLYDSIKKNLE